MRGPGGEEEAAGTDLEGGHAHLGGDGLPHQVFPVVGLAQVQQLAAGKARVEEANMGGGSLLQAKRVGGGSARGALNRGTLRGGRCQCGQGLAAEQGRGGSTQRSTPARPRLLSPQLRFVPRAQPRLLLLTSAQDDGHAVVQPLQALAGVCRARRGGCLAGMQPVRGS